MTLINNKIHFILLAACNSIRFSKKDNKLLSKFNNKTLLENNIEFIKKQNFKKLNAKNTSITLGDFNNTLESKLEEIKTLDLAFIDGNHQEKPTIDYFEKCLKYANNDTIFIFDDVHWSEGMENAWNYIKTHQKTTLTIDLFFVGVVFLKSELSKENFTIKF